MDDTIKKEVLTLVKDIFSEKEEADMRKRTEKALQESADTISNLTDALESEKTEVSSLEEKVAELTESLKDTESKLEAANKEVIGKDSDLEKVQLELSELKKSIAANKRMAELEAAGVVRSDKEAQRAKVIGMDDKEFASYKEELVAIRTNVKDELEKAAKKAKEEADKQATADSKPDDNNNSDGSTPPADIAQQDVDSAALNLESASKEDHLSKYESLGKALANMLTK